VLNFFEGFGTDENASIFTISEIIVGFWMFIPIGIMMLFSLSIWNLVAYHALIWVGLTCLLILTIIYDSGKMEGVYFMVISGVCTFTAEMPFNSILGDLIIALFKTKANSGFFMYITDSFGYMSSIFILFIKNFGAPQLSWVDFYLTCSYVMSITSLSLSTLSCAYYVIKYRRMKKVEVDNSENEKNSKNEEITKSSKEEYSGSSTYDSKYSSSSIKIEHSSNSDEKKNDKK
jgi:hypothetical protein